MKTIKEKILAIIASLDFQVIREHLSTIYLNIQKIFEPNNNASQEFEFLPAALEIQETPPSPIGRIIIWSIMVFFTITVIWAVIGKVDIVATAQGKIIPSGRVKTIQPLEIGVIRDIYVDEGQIVEKGDMLIVLDPTSTEADTDRLTKELAVAKLVLTRLQTLAEHIRQGKTTKAVLINSDNAPLEAFTLQQRILDNQFNEYRARLSALDSEVTKRKAELATTKEQVSKLQSTLPIITKRADSLKKLQSKKLVSESSWMEAEQKRIETKSDLATQKSRLVEIKASIKGARQQRDSVEAEFMRTTLTDLAEAKQRSTAIKQELIKAEQRTTMQTLKAPVAGVVQQLAVHTIGGVVTPAQQLMLIVPKKQNLEVEVFIQNKDIGFVHQGQIAEIKVETFPFTRYGTIDAEILGISNDAIADENLGLVYAARVLMRKSVIQVGKKLVNLTPGMAVTVEVKTGKRRLIEFFLSPLLRYKNESINER